MTTLTLSHSPIVSEKAGRATTNSRDVAAYFGKQHKNVLQSIANLECSEEFRVLNFQHTPYIDEQNGQTYTMVDMTKDGFIFLAFRNNGFVGATGTHLETFKEIAEHHYKMQPKDHLWVREAWRAIYFEDDYKPSELLHDEPIYYEADKYIRCTQRLMDISDIGKKRPSMFMPKWASRITLIVKDVRVERLQYISEEDAKNEGAEPILVPPDGGSEPYREGFHTLWDSINGKDKDKCWDANPYVAAISFEPILKNIEEVER